MPDTFTLFSDDLHATVSTYGARLDTFAFRGGPSLILSADPHAHPEWYDVYAGAIVGPVANRVRGGTVAIGETTYQMPRNENGTTALHSGPDGLDRRVWDVMHADPSTLWMQCTLRDGEGGLPGTRQIEVTYALDANTLTLTIEATTDAPTPISIAHHPYWRLGSAADHRLEVEADTYLPVDATNIPTGQIAPVAGTPFDHRIAKPLDVGMDHNLCLSRSAHANPRPIATLTGTGGMKVQIDSTEPGLQVYAGAFLPTLPDTDIVPFAGVALEPQAWPDAVNHPEFPNVIRTPDLPYRQITLYSCTRAT
jgi:aldose 1-epimerase